MTEKQARTLVTTMVADGAAARIAKVGHEWLALWVPEKPYSATIGFYTVYVHSHEQWADEKEQLT